MAANEKSSSGLTHRTIPHMKPFCVLISSLNFSFKLFFSTMITQPLFEIIQFFDIAAVRLKRFTQKSGMY